MHPFEFTFKAQQQAILPVKPDADRAYLVCKIPVFAIKIELPLRQMVDEMPSSYRADEPGASHQSPLPSQLL